MGADVVAPLPVYVSQYGHTLPEGSSQSKEQVPLQAPKQSIEEHSEKIKGLIVLLVSVVVILTSLLALIVVTLASGMETESSTDAEPFKSSSSSVIFSARLVVAIVAGVS